MFEKQKTIADKISFHGIGLYTKIKSTITLIPAPKNTGFLFIRKDLKENPCIESSLIFFKNSIDKGFFLEKNGIKVYSIEHIMAAVNGMNLDNIIMELNHIEIPIMDGTSKFFMEGIEKVGIKIQNAERKYYFIKKIFLIKNEKTKGKIIAIPSDKFEIKMIIDFESNNIKIQNAFYNHQMNHLNKISNSRIFCNIIDKLNIKNNNFNEIAEHNLLDFIGIFSLTKIKIKGEFFIYNPDNSMIIKFFNILKNKIEIEIKKRKKLKKSFFIDFHKKKPIFDIKNIMKILPHKPPFLLVDKIMEMSENHIIGIKNLTINEYFFSGHFPNEPIMPGVLQIEALAQVGGILILNQFKNPELYSTYFLKIDKVKFKQKIIPGDIVIFQVFLLEKMKRGIVHMKGKGYIFKKLVVEAEMMAQILKRKEDK